MTDYSDAPDFKAWKKDVQENLIPKLEDSGCTVSLMPEGETDVKFAVELGLSIMLEKPIIIVVAPGTKVPLKLAQIADEIVDTDWHTQPAYATAAIKAAVDRLRQRGLL